MSIEKISQQIEESNYVSRDLSWLQFNYRVLDQARHIDRSIFDRLKFLSITASNLDEFCTIRLGSLYNYIDYGKERFDYNGLREEPFRILLLSETRRFYQDQNECYMKKLKPLFESNGFSIAGYADLSVESIDDAQRHDGDNTRQDEQSARHQAAGGAMHQPADIGCKLLRLGSGQQHAVVERVQKTIVRKPTPPVDQLAVHDGDLPRGPAERNPAELHPEAQRLPERHTAAGSVPFMRHASPTLRRRGCESAGGRR